MMSMGECFSWQRGLATAIGRATLLPNQNLEIK
jgi:hypothetical protein